MRSLCCIVLLALIGGCAVTQGAVTEAPKLVIFPAPGDEPASPAYAAKVNGQPLFVYAAKVRHAIWQKPGLWSHHPGCAAEETAFACFDFTGRVEVEITPARPFKSAQLLPTSAGIATHVKDGVISFTLDGPRPLTLLLDGSDAVPLHLFCSAPETDVPDPRDPNVISFGPGSHDISTLKLKSNQTLYLAGGAILRAVLKPEDKGTYSERYQITFHPPFIDVKDAQHVRIRGRGIIDASLLPHPARTSIRLDNSSDVSIDGIIIRDSANWAIMIGNSERVSVTNVKEISGRLNSDGINTVSSQHVRIADCFVRNRDDSIVVKTMSPKREASDVLVENCTIWNDWGYALGVTYETRAPIHDVTFRNCDIIYSDRGAMGVHVCDSATVSDITFENIRVENAQQKLLWLAVVRDQMFGNDPTAGQIRDINFHNIVCTAAPGKPLPHSEINGLDATHRVEKVMLRDVTLNGTAAADLAQLHLTANSHTADITVESSSHKAP